MKTSFLRAYGQGYYFRGLQGDNFEEFCLKPPEFNYTTVWDDSGVIIGSVSDIYFTLMPYTFMFPKVHSL